MKDESVKRRTGAELRALRGQRTSVATTKSRLQEYKDVIVKGQRNFVEVGTALGLIAKESLFKEDGYGSFEAMVAAEFDMSSSTAYRLVDAARVVTILSQVGTVQSKIRNQSQALALAPLVKDREAMVLVITAAEATGQRLTADLLTDTRVEMYPHTKVIDGEVVADRPAIEAPKSPLVEAIHKAIEDAQTAVDDLGKLTTPANSVAPAGDGLVNAEPVPGNPQDSPDALPATSTGLQPANDLEGTHPGPPAGRPLPSDTADGPTGSVATDQLGTQTFTEGQATATPSKEPVLPSAPAGVSEADGVEDGPVSLGAGLSSTDLALLFMTGWRGFVNFLVSADRAAIAPKLTGDDYAEMDDDYTTIGRLLDEMRES